MFRSIGKNEPDHYMLKIESFSLLSEAGTKKFESDIFEASGYKWSAFKCTLIINYALLFFVHINNIKNL